MGLALERIQRKRDDTWRNLKYDRKRMNHFGPRQRKADGRWEYTVENDNVINAVGYCAGWVERTIDDFHFFFDEHAKESALREQNERRLFIEMYHINGHEHAADACMCYRLYLLDNVLRLNVKLYDKQMACLVCQKITNMCAEIDVHNFYILCDEHRNKKTVAELYLRPGVFSVTSS